MLSMVLIFRLFNNDDIHFRRPDKSERAHWWDILLIIHWASTRAASAAYNSVMTATGTSWDKTTPLRKYGTEYASSRGELSPMEATFNKISYRPSAVNAEDSCRSGHIISGSERSELQNQQ
jgi:hypothetical protein